MARKYYLGIDQGTTGITAILLDERWRLAAKGYSEIGTFYPESGWVEHDPAEICEKAVAVVREAVSAAGLKSDDEIACVGIAHEGESVVLWDKVTGRPVYNVIVWQDRRTARYADELQQTHGELIRERTGLAPDSYFSATKIRWVLSHVEEARELVRSGRLLAGTLDTWMIWNLSGRKVHVTDASTASRTMLFNIRTHSWDQEILDLLEIPREILPEICDSAMVYGHTDPDAFLGLQIPISGAAVDQQAALMGQACVRPGSIKTTYGTGCFMLMNTGDEPVLSRNGLLPTVAWKLKDRCTYALDGGVYIAGAAVKWLRDGLKILRSAGEAEAMANGVKDNGGVYFVPAFAGLAAPHWDPYARGMMIGITGGTTQEHIVRATLESIAFQVSDVLDVMRLDAKQPIVGMRCDGGASANRFLMQFQADILGLPLDVPEIAETTGLGAAYLAALGTGEIAGLHELSGYWKLASRYEPRMSEDQRQSLLFDWHRAAERAKRWAAE